MKKVLFVLAAGTILVGLSAGCCTTRKTTDAVNEPAETIRVSANEQSGVEMKVYPERNGGAPESLKLTVTNKTDKVIQFGAGYSIERLVAGQWEKVELGNFAVISIMYMLQPNGTGEYTISLFPDRVNYPEGDYRLVKRIGVGEESRDFYAPFKIIEPRG